MGRAPQSGPQGWDGLLEEGEEILWQGPAEPVLDWSRLLRKRSLGAGIMIFFGLTWLTMTLPQSGFSEGSMPVIFPLAGCVFLGFGLSQLLAPALRDYRRLKGTTYTLTTRNAHIAVALNGKAELETYPLGPDTRPTLEEGNPGSVWFSVKRAKAGGWRGSGAGGSYGDQDMRVGFEAIPDARRVYRLMLDQLTRRAEEAAK